MRAYLDAEFVSAHPHCETAFPAGAKVSAFQQILVIGALRPDRLVKALSMFAAKSLKLMDLGADTSLKGLLHESRESTPMLIVTSGGADPLLQIMELAKERNISRFDQVTSV